MTRTSFIIMAHRSSGSIFGEATRQVKRNGVLQYFDTYEEAEAEAERLNDRCTPNCWYTVQEGV